MICHKAALGFYTDFFDAAFYGGMAETIEGTIRLPEESTTGIATFIGWVYSGQVRNSICAEELWIVGERLRSTMFCNETMHFMLGLYGLHYSEGGRWLSARSMDLIYGKTTENSKLLLFARHTLKAGGPLCPRAVADDSHLEEGKAHEQDRYDLIQRGGDLDLSLALEKSFYGDLHEDSEYDEDDGPDCLAPWKRSNQKKYMFPITERTVK